MEAALAGHPQQVDLDDLPGFEAVAVSRYAATRPRLLHWFDTYNKGRPYARAGAALRLPQRLSGEERGPARPVDAGATASGTRQGRVLPSGSPRWSRPTTPTRPWPCSAASTARRASRVPAALLKTYRQALARYHLHPEAKFYGGDYTDAGVLVATSHPRAGHQRHRAHRQGG